MITKMMIFSSNALDNTLVVLVLVLVVVVVVMLVVVGVVVVFGVGVGLWGSGECHLLSTKPLHGQW